MHDRERLGTHFPCIRGASSADCAQAGESYVSLRQSVKHEVAVRLLRETNLSVQEIADFLCFSSAANFATAFRRWNGVTPSAYRQRVR